MKEFALFIVAALGMILAMGGHTFGLLVLAGVIIYDTFID